MSAAPTPTLPAAEAAAGSALPGVTVVIPALNEARRIAQVVAYARADPATLEVLVVDDSSTDDTAALAREAGARVITSTMLGKGPSMCDGVRAASHELIVYLDGDLAGLRPGIVSDLARPLRSGQADFVKARFGRGGGRVTELTAKPMLKVFFPEVAHFAQPLGGLIAARRSLLLSLPFEDGYGVDIGLLLDAQRAGARLAEVDIGSLEHDSQPLHDLTVMANEVSRVIYSRARACGRLNVDQIVAMYESQRQAAAELATVMSRRCQRQHLLLLDMDGTVTAQRFVVEMARATGRETELMKLLDQPEPAAGQPGSNGGGDAGPDAATRSERIAALFRFVHQREFERVARGLELRPGVIAFVNRMRRAGFMVGLVSDSWFVAADIVRKRLFADFALAHTLQFDNEVCSGQLRINPAFQPLQPGGEGPALCKRHVLQRVKAEAGRQPLLSCWAVGDNVNDLGLLLAADRAFAIDPKSPLLIGHPRITVVQGFDELLALAPEPAAPARPPSPTADPLSALAA